MLLILSALVAAIGSASGVPVPMVAPAEIQPTPLRFEPGFKSSMATDAACSACQQVRAASRDACEAHCDAILAPGQAAKCKGTCLKMAIVADKFPDADACVSIGYCRNAKAPVWSEPLKGNATTLPVVLMHGVNSDAASMENMKKWIETSYPGTYVKNVEIGDGKLSSVFMDMNDQVANFCEQLSDDPNLANGINLLGFSQGTAITRGYVSRCNFPRVHNYVSLAGVQAGVFGAGFVPSWLDPALSATPYEDWAQHAFSFCQYWKDPYDLDLYMEKSTFLADLENCRPDKNPLYKENIGGLNKLILIYSSRDDVIRPRPSGWFEFYAPLTELVVVPLNESALYTEDWVGVRKLDEENKLIREETDCLHSEHNMQTCYHFIEQFVLTYFAPPPPADLKALREQHQ